jgi:hypothetical protein
VLPHRFRQVQTGRKVPFAHACPAAAGGETMNAPLEDLKPDAGIQRQAAGEQLLFCRGEADLVLVSGGRTWSLRAVAHSTGCPERTTSRSSKADA